MNDTLQTPPARLGTVKPYSPPKPRAKIIHKLDANEGPEPLPGLQTWINEHIFTNLSRYPTNAHEFEAFIAERHAVSTDRVILTAGVDDALFRLCMATLEPGRTATMMRPTFEMIPTYADLAQGETNAIDWYEGDFPRDAFIQSAASERNAVSFLVTPNNPTGLAISAEDLDAVCEKASGLVAVDLAYAEFDDEDLTNRAVNKPNTVTLRTLSKAWGLAGLRVGYAIADPEVIARLRAAGNPYPVSRPSIAIAHRWLQDGKSFVEETVAQAKSEREDLQALLKSLDINTTNSKANFVFADLRTKDNAETLRHAMAAKGFAIRGYPNRPNLDRYLRITCPANAAVFADLVGALKASIKEARA